MVGIINVQWFDNPGAVLLCYAIQQYLDKKNVDNIIINYTSGGGGTDNKRSFLTKVKERLILYKRKMTVVDGTFFYKALKERNTEYNRFRSEYLRRTPAFLDIKSKYLEGYSSYLVGSDVVWKPEIISSKDADIYFLNFPAANNAKKISLSASVGTNQLDKIEKYKNLYVEYLSKFNYISVREKMSADYFRELLSQNIETLLDPVFLLNEDEYNNIIDCSEDKNKPYIYLYMLSPNKETVEFVKKLSKKTGYRILYDLHTVDNLFLKKELEGLGIATIADGPDAFLRRIKNAEYVVTNSFHGTAFSIIFKKSFYTFSCVNGGVDVSLRMKNLIELLELDERYNPDYKIIDLNKKIDYELVGGKLLVEKEKAYRFINESMNIN